MSEWKKYQHNTLHALMYDVEVGEDGARLTHNFNVCSLLYYCKILHTHTGCG